VTRPNSSHTGKRRKNRARVDAIPALSAEQRAACEAAIGYAFKDEKLLDRSMTHRSAAQGKSAEWSNERLEFLGDRVLGLVIVEALMVRFPPRARANWPRVSTRWSAAKLAPLLARSLASAHS
jgi:ribonuclease-3